MAASLGETPRVSAGVQAWPAASSSSREGSVEDMLSEGQELVLLALLNGLPDGTELCSHLKGSSLLGGRGGRWRDSQWGALERALTWSWEPRTCAPVLDLSGHATAPGQGSRLRAV